MKIITSLAASVVFCSLVGCSHKKTDLNIANLKGNVKTITENSYSAKDKFGEIFKDSLQKKITTSYNTAGLISETIEYELPDTMPLILRSEYDSIGNLVRKLNLSPKNGEVIQSWFYDYDAGNHLFKMHNGAPHDKLDSIGFTYTTYKYDSGGHLVGSKDYNIDGLAESSVSYKTDENGNELESDFSRDDKIVEVHNRKYDGDNQLIEQKIFTHGELLEYTEYRYENHEIIEEIRHPTSPMDDSVHIDYEYKNLDEKGNWKRSVLRWTKGKEDSFRITERTITYYK